MPIGYLLAVAVSGLGMVLSLAPLARSGRAGRLSWFVSLVPNESPFLAFYWMVAVTVLAVAQGDLAAPAETPVAWLGLSLAAVTFVGAPLLVRRSLLARAVVDSALEDVHRRPSSGSDRHRRSVRQRLPWFRILFAPVPILPLDLKQWANISYGPAGRFNRLDVYRRRGRRPAGPVLIHLHGGHFRTGMKSFEGRPLLHRLARRGWLCVSANYRLHPAVTFPDYVVDAKRVIAWVRDHAHEYGGDPTQVFLAGSSAGAHIATTAALTANDPRFQPGFDHADTAVAAAVGLYGYYGPVDAGRALASEPAAYAHEDAPPMLIAHGDQDTYVPPDNARRFVERIRAGSAAPVVYIELPGGQHSFDLLHTIRFETLIDGIESFAAWVRNHRRESSGQQQHDLDVFRSAGG